MSNPSPSNPSRRHRRTVGLALGALAVALALALTGCGKKPKTLEIPQPEGQPPFPGTYPNPKLDPKPGEPSSGMKFP